MKRALFTACLLTAALAFPISAARADDVTDLYFQEVLERYYHYPQNARTFGMAGSSVQTSTDSSSVMGNPAGMGFMEGGEISGSYGHNEISGDEFPTDESVRQTSNSGSGLLTVPLGPTLDGLPNYGNLGIGWAMTDSEWKDDSFDTEAEQQQVTIAYAYPVWEDVSLGYSLGWFDEKLQSHAIFDYPMANGLRHTLGALWQKDPETKVGSSFFFGHGDHHALYGPGIKETTDTTEFGIDVGVEWIHDRFTFAIGGDYRHLSSDGDVEASIPANIVGGDENGNIFDVRGGLEYAATEELDLRAGYRFAGLSSYNYNRVELNDLNGSANYSAFTLGAGYAWPIKSDYIKSINLDYGVEYRMVGDQDFEHRVTVSMPFTLCDPNA